METFVLIVGYTAILAASLLAILLSVYGVAVIIDGLARRRDKLVRELAAADLGLDIYTNAWWFSEDEPTRLLLQDIGDTISKSRRCGFCVDELRDKWRGYRAVHSQVCAEPAGITEQDLNDPTARA